MSDSCDPLDCSPPGSSVHGIFQARILEWIAISFSRALPDPGIEPRSPALQADSLQTKLRGKLSKPIHLPKFQSLHFWTWIFRAQGIGACRLNHSRCMWEWDSLFCTYSFLLNAVAYSGKMTGMRLKRPESIPSSVKSPQCALELITISCFICKMRRLNWNDSHSSSNSKILDDPQTSTVLKPQNCEMSCDPWGVRFFLLKFFPPTKTSHLPLLIQPCLS